MTILSLALGGSLGAVFRYVLSGFFSKLFPDFFPYGTLFVNLIGSFFIGVFWEFFQKVQFHSDIKIFLLIGVLGSFTTFSTYSLETINLLLDGQIKLTIFNLLLNNFGGMLLVLAGFFLTRYIFLILK